MSATDRDFLGLGLVWAHEREDAVRRCDSVAQQLFAIGVTAKAGRASADAASLAEALRQIESMAAEARRELRAARAEAVPGAPRTHLESDLQREARALALRAACRVAVTSDGTPRVLEDEAHRLFVDTARDVLDAVLRQDRVHLVVAHVRYTHDSVALSVQCEDGRGRGDLQRDLGRLRSRAHRLRGTLDESSDADGMPVVRLVIPTGRGEVSRG